MQLKSGYGIIKTRVSLYVIFLLDAYSICKGRINGHRNPHTRIQTRIYPRRTCKRASRDGLLYPHLYDEEYDSSLPLINLVQANKKYEKCTTCMCNSFGFGGTNASLVLKRI